MQDCNLYGVYKHFFPPPDHLISFLNISHTLPCSLCLCFLPPPPPPSVWSHYLITIQDVPSVRACWSQKVNRAVTTLSPAYAIRCWRIGSRRHAAIWLGNCQQSMWNTVFKCWPHESRFGALNRGWAHTQSNQIKQNYNFCGIYIHSPSTLTENGPNSTAQSFSETLITLLHASQKNHEHQSFSFTEHVTVQNWKFNGLSCWTGNHMYTGYFPSMIQINYACNQACIYPYLNSLHILQQVDEGVDSDKGNSVGIHGQWIMVCLLLSVYACRTGVHHWDSKSLFLPWLVRMKKKERERERVKRNVHTSVFLKFSMKTIIIFFVGIWLVLFWHYLLINVNKSENIL